MRTHNLMTSYAYIYAYICYVRIYCCKSDHVRLLCSQSTMAYNSVDRCQLKTGTRPFPLLHASAVNRYDEACARGSGVRVFLPRPLAFAAAPRCSIGVRQALQPCGWRALVQRASFRFWLVQLRAVLSKLGITCSNDRLVPGCFVLRSISLSRGCPVSPSYK